MVIQKNELAEIVTGALVLVVALGFLAWSGGVIGWFGGADSAKTYRVSLISGRGVTEGTDVRIAGVKVGRVDWITLNPQTFTAETELALDPQYNFPEDSLAVVSSEGLLGGTYVEIIPGRSSFTLDPGERFRTAAPDVSIVDLLIELMNGNGSR